MQASEFEDKWQAPTSAGYTLVTTRTDRYLHAGMVMPIGRLEPDAALALLTNGKPPEWKPGLNAAHQLLKALVYHPLAVDVAGRLFENNGWTFSELSGKICDESLDPFGGDAQKTGVKLPQTYDTNVKHVLEIGV